MSTPDTAVQALPEDQPPEINNAEFWRVHGETTRLTGHAPSMVDMWMIGKRLMDTNHRVIAADRALRALLVDHIECAACGRYFSCEVCGSQDAEIVPAAPLLPQRKPHDHEPAAGFS